MDADIGPRGRLRLLSRREVAALSSTEAGGLHEQFRACALAVLNIGSELDDAAAVMSRYASFDVRIREEPRGIRLQLINAPDQAFVDGEIIEGIREHLFSVLRDLVAASGIPQLDSPASITDGVFELLRNAGVIHAGERAPLAVCWGGHAIAREEYDYTKEVGHALGLRGIDVCTGCGPGAMKGPMKGAAVGHAKQRLREGRFLGVTEPGIIAAEPPNPIVNELVVLPDIEKRLEAFVRLGHAMIVFPGGVGTAEEILHLLGILLDPQNDAMPFPVIFTGPPSARAYFQQMHEFIGSTLGQPAQRLYRIIIDDPVAVAGGVAEGATQVFDWREKTRDAFGFNWKLRIDGQFQTPFHPTHEAMAALSLHRDQSSSDLAANLRRAFSGIVAGNVKPAGIQAVAEHGPFELAGEPAIAGELDALLRSFVEQRRMRLPGSEYVPCYRIVR